MVSWKLTWLQSLVFVHETIFKVKAISPLNFFPFLIFFLILKLNLKVTTGVVLKKKAAPKTFGIFTESTCVEVSSF